MADSTPIRGVIVDFGGVLTTSVGSSFRAFCENEGIEPDAITSHLRGDPQTIELLVGLETGKLPPEEFEASMAAILGVKADDLIKRLFKELKRNEAMLAAIDIARRSGVRTALLSNAWSIEHYNRELLGELFDVVVISSEVGLRKPERAIYALTLERIGLPAERCVYIDDLSFNLEPATELGVATIHHTDTGETIAELERMLELQLR